MIQMFHVTKMYPRDIEAIIDVNLHIEKGEFIFLVGPSGAGKSTFIRLLFLDELPTSGQVVVAGRNIAYLSYRKIPYLRRQIGVIFQDFKLLYTKTVFENVAFVLQVRGLPKGEIGKRTSDALAKVGLFQKRDSFPHQISGGEQQRVAIARAIVGQPEIILADEPTGNLDAGISKEIFDHFSLINEGGVTVIVATHNLEMAQGMGRRIIYLDQGRIVDHQ